jgi:hypothetical protein
VGWAKRPGANAFGGVPTTRRETFDTKMVGTAQMRLCPPYALKRVRYQSRGHNAAMKYSLPIWVDLDKFARDVDRAVVAHYDPDYDDR